MNILSSSDYESAAEATDNDISFEGERECLYVFIFSPNKFPLQGVLPGRQEGSAIYWILSTSRTTLEILRPHWRVSSYRLAVTE